MWSFVGAWGGGGRGFRGRGVVDLETGSLFGGTICDDCRGGVGLLLAMVPGSEGMYIRLVRRARPRTMTGSFANARSCE